MRVIVIGNGKIGDVIIHELTEEGHDVVVIDKREERLTDIQNNLDVLCICGNGVTQEVQLEAGADRADLLIAVTAMDELNLLCCLVARHLGTKHTLARVRNPEYSSQLSLFNEDLGLSMSINPERAAAQEIFSVIRFPGLMSVEEFAHGRMEMAELVLTKESEITAMTLMELSHRHHVRALVCAVTRDGKTLIPSGPFQLKKGDVISFAAEPMEADHFLQLAGVQKRMPRDIIVVGAGKVAYYLLEMMKKVRMRPVVIERDEKRCEELSEFMPHVLVIQGDGTFKQTLIEEGIESADAFVALTGTDEVNILLSMYAKRQNVPKVVTKVSHIDLEDTFIPEGIGSVISPKEIIANRVISYVRALENAGSSNVETLYRIADGHAEALEFKVRKENPKLLDIPLKDLKLKKNILLCGLIRQGHVIIPGGEDCIRLKDRVIVVTLAEQKLADLEGILA